MDKIHRFLSLSVLIGLSVIVHASERIDCFPEKKSPPSDYSKEACLARHCLFDDRALPNEIQCYSIKSNNEKYNPHSIPPSRKLSELKSRRSAILRQNSDIVTVDFPDVIKTDPKYRIDCSPDIDEYRTFCELSLSENSTAKTTNQSCTARGCLWDSSPAANTTTCYIPLTKGGYSLTARPIQLSDAVTEYDLTRLSVDSTNQFSIFKHDIEKLKVQVSLSGTDKIRMTIRDANAPRYEVPVPIQWQPRAPSSSAAQLQFQLTKTPTDQVGFRVQRTRTASILFDTSFFANGFIYDDKFLQLVTTIPSRNVYGFGENTHSSFRHVLKGSLRYAMYARDQPPLGVNENLYGTHPFYMVIEADGQAFGVLIFNSNAQDYKFDEFSTNQAMLTYRTIGGILDVMFFAGPKPEDVIRQYQSVIGNPYMPPYWGLGFQLSRYGYNNLENMRAAMMRTVNASIPLDVM